MNTYAQPAIGKIVFLVSLPVAIFAAYIALLVVPEVVQVVVPAVVQSLLGQ